MPDSFGARLRQRREERQIALSSIADDTKIKLTLLEALERDDVSHWPSGIFRRAYIKAYAHMIGLDPDEVVREFLEVHPEPAEVAAAAALAAAEEDRAEDRATAHAAPKPRGFGPGLPGPASAPCGGRGPAPASPRVSPITSPPSSSLPIAW